MIVTVTGTLDKYPVVAVKYADRVWASPALMAVVKSDVDHGTWITNSARGCLRAGFDTDYAFVSTLYEHLDWYSKQDIRIEVTRFLPPRRILRRRVRALCRSKVRAIDARLRTRAWYRGAAAEPWAPAGRGSEATSSRVVCDAPWLRRGMVTVIPAGGSQSGAVIKLGSRFWTRNNSARSRLRRNFERRDLQNDGEFVDALTHDWSAFEPVWRTRWLPPVVVLWAVVRDRVSWWWITGPREFPGLVRDYLRWFPSRPRRWWDDEAEAGWWSPDAGDEVVQTGQDAAPDELESPEPDEVLDEHFDAVIERSYDLYRDDPPYLRAPDMWLKDLITATGPATSAAGENEWELSMHDVINIALGAMEAHSIAADPGEPTDPEVLLALVCCEARALIAERGWSGGDRDVWCARIGQQVGEYCVRLSPYLAGSDEESPIEMAGPAAMGVAAAAMLAAAASDRDAN